MHRWTAHPSIFRRKIVFALRRPRYALAVAARGALSSDERFLAKLTGSSVNQVRRWLREVHKDPEIRERLVWAARILATVPEAHNDPFAKKVLIQWVIIRALRPRLVLETGIAHGVSSYLILRALERNGEEDCPGSLCSVDIGDKSFLPVGADIGWIVPEAARQAWTVVMGDATDVLPPVLQGLQTPVDVFIHDSLHTYDHMLFEFRTVWPFVCDGGVIVADDALGNDAFREFGCQTGVKHRGVARGVGVLRKEGAS